MCIFFKLRLEVCPLELMLAGNIFPLPMPCRTICFTPLWLYKTPVHACLWMKNVKAILFICLISHQFNLLKKSLSSLETLHTSSWLCLRLVIRTRFILVTMWAHSGETACSQDAIARPADKRKLLASLWSENTTNHWMLPCCPHHSAM